MKFYEKLVIWYFYNSFYKLNLTASAQFSYFFNKKILFFCKKNFLWNIQVHNFHQHFHCKYFTTLFHTSNRNLQLNVKYYCNALTPCPRVYLDPAELDAARIPLRVRYLEHPAIVKIFHWHGKLCLVWFIPRDNIGNIILNKLISFIRSNFYWLI